MNRVVHMPLPNVWRQEDLQFVPSFLPGVHVILDLDKFEGKGVQVDLFACSRCLGRCGLIRPHVSERGCVAIFPVLAGELCGVAGGKWVVWVVGHILKGSKLIVLHFTILVKQSHGN